MKNPNAMVTKSDTVPKFPRILVPSFFGSNPDGVGVRKTLLALLLFCSLLTILPAQKSSSVEKLIQQGKIGAARDLCSQLRGFSAALNWPLLGDHFFQDGELEMAIDCYERGTPVVGLARAWSGLADRGMERGDKNHARECYGRSLQAYETLIRDDRCVWNPVWNDERLAVRIKWQQLGGDGTSEREKLQPLLRRAADYCRQLEEAILSYICEETVTETVDRSQPLADVLLGSGSFLSSFGSGPSGRNLGGSAQKKQTKKLYDYMLVKESGSTTEKRILLRKSGKPFGVEESALSVTHYRLSKMIYSPIELFASSQNQAYEYHVLEERSDEAGPLVVVEVLPLSFTLNSPHSFGKAWLRGNGRVERIELNFKSIQNYEEITRMAQAHNRVPAISFVICFDKICKGLGFPSEIYLRDAFLDENGKESLVANVDIKYDQFRFYKIESRESIKE